MTSAPGFRATRDDNPHAALGRAVVYLMKKPNFETLKFGAWSRILIGQVNRKHYFFVVEDNNIVGFVGWAMTSQAKALAWLNENAPLSFEDSQSGNSLVINAWAADTTAVNRFILKTLRQQAVDKNVYAKRFYSNGTVRPLNLNPNRFIESHLKSDSANKRV